MCYTITPVVKKSARRIFRITSPTQQKIKLLRWLDKQQLSTQVLYSLLTLGLASEHLSLDKYAIFYVCEAARSRRATTVNVLGRNKRLSYLSKKQAVIEPSRDKKLGESEHCPPLVLREYRADERCTTTKDEYDLAVAYHDQRSVIPARWKWQGYIEGRAFKRDTFQFTPKLVVATISAVNGITNLSSNTDVLIEWAKPLREKTEKRLHDILECYEFDRSFRLIRSERFRSSIFAGLALFDSKLSKIRNLQALSLDSKEHIP